MHRLLTFLLISSAIFAASPTNAVSKLVLDQPELAGISGQFKLWNQPVILQQDAAVEEIRLHTTPGPTVNWSGGAEGVPAFDAVHRTMLVRFPGASAKIASELNKGQQIDKVELVLPFRDVELWNAAYRTPAGLGFLGKIWEEAPNWHAVAWALRRPWHADPQTGPTFNAFINGAGYWEKYGAADETHDRFPHKFGPGEVSVENPEGRLDVTDLVSDPEFGSTLADRLSVLENQGFMVRKWELYDARYWRGGYEWGTATGPRAIMVQNPRLEVSFKPGKGERVNPLPPADIAKEAQKWSGQPGAPTALLPDEEHLKKILATHGFRRPENLSDLQWQRAQELYAMDKGGDRVGEFPSNREEYEKWVDGMLQIPPRRWDGFSAVEYVQNYLQNFHAMPEPVRENWQLYWWAWLMPDFKHNELVQGYVGQDAARKHWEETRDWRGNFSVYRTYVRDMGTMNFNYWATAGTLLGGQIIGSDYVMSEGRHGLEVFPLRLWSWFDGSSQESVDHYYLAHSIAAQKLFADFGPDHLDRMMGRSAMSKTVEELASVYHPNLRRFIFPSGRTGIAYLLSIQDGLHHVVHTFSPKGALTDLDRETAAGGMPTLGHDFKPRSVALQTINGPWAPDWMGNVLDYKPLPYETTVNFKAWGQFSDAPLWRRSWLAPHYGLASVDLADQETVPVMAQWRRTDKPVGRMEEIGTMLLRYGINRTEFLDTLMHGTDKRNPNGVVGLQGGSTAALQHQNKMIVLTSPFPNLQEPVKNRELPDQVHSLQTSVALMNFQDAPTWEIYVDGQRINSLPLTLKQGQKITIKDGVTYVGLIPLPATDLGRDAEVIITDETGPEVEMQGGGQTRPSLVIDSYNLRRAEPIPRGDLPPDHASAFGGFIIEMGDESEYGSFAEFQKHFAQTKFEVSRKNEEVTVVYKSGKDQLECDFVPSQTGVDRKKLFTRREVNGKWPYLPDGIDRDSTLSQQGNSGRLEKSGAVLIGDEGRTQYLQSDPKTQTFAAFNPFPELTSLKLELPGGASVSADGKMGICELIVGLEKREIQLNYAWKKDQVDDPERARRVLLRGFDQNTKVLVNGSPVTLGPKEEDAFLIELPEVPSETLATDGGEEFWPKQVDRRENPATP